MAITAILDVDGTLVDTNYHHTLAWYRAFRDQDITLPLWQIHRHIGMGGDQLVGALAGDDVERQRGRTSARAEAGHYRELIDEVGVLPGSRELIQRLKDEGNAVVLASSAKEDEVEHYLSFSTPASWQTRGPRPPTWRPPSPSPTWCTSGPAERQRADEAVLVGDSVFDCEAAERAGVPTIGVLTGGFSEQELREAGREVRLRVARDDAGEHQQYAAVQARHPRLSLPLAARGRLAGMERDIEESDQLPEEAPAEQVEDDSPGDARDEAKDSAGAAGEEAGQSTGSRENAG